MMKDQSAVSSETNRRAADASVAPTTKRSVQEGGSTVERGASKTVGHGNESVLEMRGFRIPYGEGYEAQVYTCGNSTAKPLILLHGFMQDGRSWQQVANVLQDSYYLIMPDLPGHGATLMPPGGEEDLASRFFSFDAHVALVKAVIDAFISPQMLKPVLVGYSMGGRVAAAYATKHPETLRAVVLESAGLGFVTEEEKLARAEKNEKLCQRLATQPFEAFINFWENLPLFATQQHLPSSVKEEQRTARLDNDPQQLAYSLRYAGQQVMEDFRGPLAQLNLPVLYLAGQVDVTYTKVARSLLKRASLLCTPASQLEIEFVAEAGHNIHLEQPEKFCRLLRRYGK